MVWQKRYSPPGASPGTLEHIPAVSTEVRMTAIHYTPEHYTEEDITDLGAYLKALPSEGILWLNVDGLGNVSVLKTIGTHFDLHPLCLEDVLNVPQRPAREAVNAFARNETALVTDQLRVARCHDAGGSTRRQRACPALCK